MPQLNAPILLVEDDLSLRASLCQFLSESGYRTVVAETTRQGWELILSRQPWFCLLDMNLPDGSGLDLLKRIIRQRLPIRVVVMTAFELNHMRPADPLGVVAGWMVKPVNPLELLKLVQDGDRLAAPVDNGRAFEERG